MRAGKVTAGRQTVLLIATTPNLYSCAKINYMSTLGHAYKSTIPVAPAAANEGNNTLAVHSICNHLW